MYKGLFSLHFYVKIRMDVGYIVWQEIRILLLANWVPFYIYSSIPLGNDDRIFF